MHFHIDVSLGHLKIHYNTGVCSMEGATSKYSLLDSRGEGHPEGKVV